MVLVPNTETWYLWQTNNDCQKKIFFVIFFFYSIQFFSKKDFLKFPLLTDLEKNLGAFPSSPIRFPWVIYFGPTWLSVVTINEGTKIWNHLPINKLLPQFLMTKKERFPLSNGSNESWYLKIWILFRNFIWYDLI